MLRHHRSQGRGCRGRNSGSQWPGWQLSPLEPICDSATGRHYPGSVARGVLISACPVDVANVIHSTTQLVCREEGVALYLDQYGR